MKLKSVLMALGVISTIVLGNGMTAHAETTQTETKAETSAKDVVTVNAGDTLDAIATAHGTTYVRLFNANSSIVNPDVIHVGDEITIPTADEQLPDRFAQLMAVVAVAPTATVAQAATPAPSRCDEATQWVRADNGQCIDKPGAYRQAAAPQAATQPVAPAAAAVSGSHYTGNGMWCTDYVHSRRPDVPIYGNAGYNWISAAQADGKATGTTPRAGAIAVMSGHVAYVESVNADGSYVVSEMGWMYKAGNYNIRTVQPGTFGAFIY
jgi:surface antigen